MSRYKLSKTTKMRQLISITLSKVLFLLCFVPYTLIAQSVVFATKVSHATTSPINHSSTDGKPRALVFIQQNSGEKGPNCGYPVGIAYEGGKWNLKSLIAGAPMPLETNYNIMVIPTASACAFKHIAGSTPSNRTLIKNDLINGRPGAKLIITQDATNKVLNPKNVGVKCEGGRWYIMNEDGSNIPARAQFNVYVVDDAFVHRAELSSVHPSWPSTSIIDNAMTNRKKDIYLFGTHEYRSKKIDSPLSVWWDEPNYKWNIFGTNAVDMRNLAGELFHVYVFSSSSSCAPTGRVLRITTKTGGDDLRGYNTAFFSINFVDGTSSREYLLHKGHGNGQQSEQNFTLDSPIVLSDVRGITIRHDGSPTFPDTYDNWNLDYLKIVLVPSTGTAVTVHESSGSPLVRFTGDRRTFVALKR
jgi:hypothetical protein